VTAYENKFRWQDYMHVLWKRKKTLFGVVLFVAIVAVFVFFRQPDIYDVSMVIQSPCVDVDFANGKLLFWTDFTDIQEVMNQDFSHTFKIKTEKMPHQSWIRATIRVPFAHIEIAKNGLNQFAVKLEEFYRDFIDIKQKEIEWRITRLSMNRGAEEKKTAKLKKELTFRQKVISNIKIVDGPKVSESPVKPNRKQQITGLVIAGGFLGIIVIFLQEAVSLRRARR